jgi:hypothetical protein
MRSKTTNQQLTDVKNPSEGEAEKQVKGGKLRSRGVEATNTVEARRWAYKSYCAHGKTKPAPRDRGGRDMWRSTHMTEDQRKDMMG